MKRLKDILLTDRLLTAIIVFTAILLMFTVDRYYGYYYDNKFFNLLGLELWEKFRVYLYLGSHYHVPSSLYSYLVYPFFLIFGPTDLSMELLASIFHLSAVIYCYKLASGFYGRTTGLIFALFAALAPIHLVQIYTLPDLSFATLLNIAAIYYFLKGIKEASRSTVILSAVLYSLGVFQAVYSLLLLPFYIFYALYFLLPKSDLDAAVTKAGDRPPKALYAALVCASIPAFIYAGVLSQLIFFKGTSALGSGVYLALLASAVYAKGRFRFSKGAGLGFLFLFISATILLYLDLMVQIDFNLFEMKHTGRSLGYFLDAAPAGGYGGRPAVSYMGRDIHYHDAVVYASVLTSIFNFAGGDFAKASWLDFTAVKRLYYDYFLLSYPAAIRLLVYAGVATLVCDGLNKRYKGERLIIFHLFPLVWLVAAASPFIDLGPAYYNIRRIYIAPLPYLLAAAGAAGLSSLFARAVNFPKASAFAAAFIAIAVSAGQMNFDYKNIYLKYDADKKSSMYFKLFYGHYYGRSYKEAGDFLLKDAPLKKDGVYRSLLVFAIPEDTTNGRSLPLYNSINWYTKNRIEVVSNFQAKSTELYGSKTRLNAYLQGLFKARPELKVIYFADFVDTKNNYAFFSRFFPKIKPYAIIDDDGSVDFDCKLYKFERGIE